MGDQTVQTGTLTRTERFILNEVDSVPDKIVSADTVRRAVGLTPVGFRRVLTRLINDSMLARTDGNCITLTFGGMCAMRDSGMEVQ